MTGISPLPSGSLTCGRSLLPKTEEDPFCKLYYTNLTQIKLLYYKEQEYVLYIDTLRKPCCFSYWVFVFISYWLLLVSAVPGASGTMSSIALCLWWPANCRWKPSWFFTASLHLWTVSCEAWHPARIRQAHWCYRRHYPAPRNRALQRTAWTKRQEWLLSELGGKRPLFGPDLPKTEEVADVLDTFHVISQLPSDNFGDHIISMATAPSDVLAVELLQRECRVKQPLRVVPLFENSRIMYLRQLLWLVSSQLIGIGTGSMESKKSWLGTRIRVRMPVVCLLLGICIRPKRNS